ncbi:MAG: sugar ABC transporter permease [Sphaerochaeta sp.]|jgi:oligogalacturonide transport system permease protein|uniref:carbohydrate ABC transporter permease n=1 Tax=unclassified Sphaerochaeta TaxID=2637943 RepID=UPI000EC3FB2A|nr:MULTISPECIES: sugar ABC transporter permease [unclassified Sphaerochaeta]MCK9600338.1 sugar ABC transporter permease [Sphaerochaeta sp.]MDX9824822.1 sugar ABC transporter permease [Sphaerochaeta sp.]MEA4863782.1 sugar ABC transporter permease [Sphaerochaeta sp.]HCU30264.1 sugar ABC transporter permease [Sphaerochaeta sp.]
MLTRKRYNYTGYLYILPWIIGFLLLQLVPLINSFWYSFTNFQLLGDPKFLGLENYKKIFTADPTFLQSLKVTSYYVLIAVPLKISFALVIAIILNQNIKGINLFRTLYYIPSILGGSVAISVLWKYLFMNQGVVNNLIGQFGFKAVDWLGDPRFALGTISLVTVWQFGSSMLLFLAGLKQIPVSQYEAARIDGAGRMRIFWQITIPELSPIILFNLIMQMINAFQDFTSAFVITQGGPLKSTYLYGLMLYDQGFKFFKMGYSSALSWILFAIILFFTSLTFRSSESWVHYGDSL